LFQPYNPIPMPARQETKIPPEIETHFRGIAYFFSETGSEGGSWAFMDERFTNQKTWDYAGLHVLHDGDKLTIFDKENPDNVLWQGVIELTEQTNFEEDVFGYWIHNTQKGTDKEQWGRWFINENPAELELGKKSIEIIRKLKAKKN